MTSLRLLRQFDKFPELSIIMSEVETMKQAVASLRTEGTGKTAMSGAGTPSYPSGIATGHQNPTERSFALEPIPLSPRDGEVLETIQWWRSHLLRSLMSYILDSQLPSLTAGVGASGPGETRCYSESDRLKRQVKGREGHDEKGGGSDTPSNTSPCATCPQRDDCGAWCNDYWSWHYGGGR